MTHLIFRDGTRCELVDRTADQITYKRADGVCVKFPGLRREQRRFWRPWG